MRNNYYTQQVEIYNRLRNDILSGKIKRGKKITEKQISEMMGVKRGPVRESLIRLEGEGLIRKFPSHGYFVEDYSEENIEENYNIRMALESLASRQAAKKATRDDLVRLTLICEDEERFFKQGNQSERQRCDEAFHQQLVVASGSKLLMRIYSLITLSFVPHHDSPQISKKAVKEHQEILEAIRKKDSKAAYRLTQQHLSWRKIRGEFAS